VLFDSVAFRLERPLLYRKKKIDYDEEEGTGTKPQSQSDLGEPLPLNWLNFPFDLC